MSFVKLTHCLLILASLSVICNGDYIGKLCGSNWGKKHLYPPKGATVMQCITHCGSATVGPYKYAGLLAGKQCLCGNDTPYPICAPGSSGKNCVNGGNCSTAGIPCTADPTMVCGGTDWYSLYNSDGTSMNVITKWSTTADQVCSGTEKNCDFWSCDVAGGQYDFPLTAPVIGSETYDIASSYCLAAMHDGRYSPGSSAVKIVSSSVANHGEVQGSWRNGIQSIWSSPGKTTHQFSFSSPSRSFDFNGDSLWTFVDLSNRYITCRRYGDGGTLLFLSSLADKLVTGGARDSSSISKVALPEYGSPTEMYYCGLNSSTKGRLSSTFVPIVVGPTTGAGAAVQRTISVKVGQNASITFDVSKLSGVIYTVKKADHEVVSNDVNKQKVTYQVTKATVKDGGFYDLYDQAGKWYATIRLIVTAGNPVATCNSFNAFQREDGTCLCIPPFGGDVNCSKICNANKLDGTFGPNCDMNCGSDECKGIMTCGQDPFGCKCGSGWTGPTCSDACPTGTYGPDCAGTAQGCHCAGGNGGCNRVTGSCPFGCEPGYFHDDCKAVGGFLKEYPVISQVSHDSMNISWLAWNGTVDGGTISPDGYYLNVKGCAVKDGAWKNATSTMFKAGQSRYSYDVSGLDVQECYMFRVQTVVGGFVMPVASETVQASTICGQPTSAVQSMFAVPGNLSILVSWKWPDASTWQCKETVLHWVYTIAINPNCGIQNVETFYWDEYANVSDSDTYGAQIFAVPQHAIVSFTGRLTNDQKLYGPDVSKTGLHALPSSPGEVTDFTSGLTADGGILLAWMAPWGAAGWIQGYHVKVVPVEGPGSEFITNTTSTHIDYEDVDLYKGGKYNVSIIAWNDLGLGAEFLTTITHRKVTPQTTTSTVKPTTPKTDSSTTKAGMKAHVMNRALIVTALGILLGIWDY